MRSAAPGSGHNTSPRAASQWQDPKADESQESRPAERDLDLVEQEFHRLVLTSTDPTSLLRLARVPFVADIGDGKLMRLLRVSVSDEIEVGAISPGYAGKRCRISPGSGIARATLAKSPFRLSYAGWDPSLHLSRGT